MKNEKKFFVILGLFLAIVGLVGMTSCKRNTLESYVKTAQKKLPFDMGNGLTLVGLEVTADNLDLMSTSDERDFRFDDSDFRKEQASIQKYIGEQCIKMLENSSNDDFKELMALCAKEGKGMRWIVKGNKSGATITLLNLSPDELSKIK